MSLENNYVFNLLKQSNHKLYLVGGAVRDLIVGNKPKDFDAYYKRTVINNFF